MIDPRSSVIISEIHFWTPVVGTAVTIWKGYSFLKHNFISFADKLLDNHLSHLQASLDNIDAAQTEQIELLKKLADK